MTHPIDDPVPSCH